MSKTEQNTVEVVRSGERPDVRPEYGSVFYYFRNVLPLQSELSDQELLRLAEKTGAFEFLANEGEDIYSLADGEAV